MTCNGIQGYARRCLKIATAKKRSSVVDLARDNKSIHLEFPARSGISLRNGEVMNRISDAVANAPGDVVVAGHTDDIPISTARFRSNWELSSARAVTVLHALLDDPRIDQARVRVEGYGESRPLVPNDSSESRAKNRRVELIIERGGEADGIVEPSSPAESSG